jgi:hypothetical protein
MSDWTSNGCDTLNKLLGLRYDPVSLLNLMCNTTFNGVTITKEFLNCGYSNTYAARFIDDVVSLMCDQQSKLLKLLVSDEFIKLKEHFSCNDKDILTGKLDNNFEFTEDESKLIEQFNTLLVDLRIYTYVYENISKLKSLLK